MTSYSYRWICGGDPQTPLGIKLDDQDKTRGNQEGQHYSVGSSIASLEVSFNGSLPLG